MDTGHEDSHLPLLNDLQSITTATAVFCSRNPLKIPDELDELVTSPTQCCVQRELKSSTKQTHSRRSFYHYHTICLPCTTAALLVYLYQLFFDLLVSENLCIDDLKKLQDWLLLRIYNTSETLVELLQERQQLSEEAHVRLISIEQLHRLLEARCFYRGLSTGLFS